MPRQRSQPTTLLGQGCVRVHASWLELGQLTVTAFDHVVDRVQEAISTFGRMTVVFYVPLL